MADEFANGSHAAQLLLPFIRGERPDGPYFVLSEAVQDADSLFAIPAGLFDVLPNSLVTTSHNTVSMN